MNLIHIMKLTLRLHFSYIAASMLACGAMMGCTNSRKASPHDLEVASERARSQAVELATLTDTLQMEATLINVRERETFLRNNGMNDVADIYIETFLTTLDSVSPSLASQLH